MIHQAAAKFARAIQQDGSSDDERNPDRQRGMWSFLTWSFFLAQAVAAHEALAAGHGAQDGPEMEANGGSHDPTVTSASVAPPLVGGIAGEGGYAADAKVVAAAAAVATAPQALAGNEAADKAQSVPDGETVANGVDVVVGSGTTVAGSDSAGPSASEVGSADPCPGSTIVLPVDVATSLGLELNADPVIGLDLGVSNGAGITINLGEAPIVGLVPTVDDGLDVNVSIAGSTVLDLGLGLDFDIGDGNSVLSVNILGLDLDIGGGLPSLLDAGGLPLSVLTPILDTVETLTGLPSQVLDLPAVSAITSTALDTIDPTVQATTSIVDTALDLVGADSPVASAGAILYPVTNALPLTELFANGGYTAYSMELQQAAPLGLPLDLSASTTADLDSVASTDIALLSAGDDAHSELTLSSVVESLNLRALGDAFA